MDTKPKIPFITIIAAVVGFGAMLFGAMMEGANVMAFFNIPALLIIGGGTCGATMAAVGLDKFLKIGKAWMTAQQAASPNWEATARELVRAADIVRKEGALKLQDEARDQEDEFLKMAYNLIADGTDANVIREILWAKIETETHRLKEYADIFAKMGGFAPTMGIIGTVMGLTHALMLLNEPDSLGPAIAGAFMATFYGVSSANLLWTPTGDRITALSKERKEWRGMMVAAAMSIQRGDSSRDVAEKLSAMSPVPLDPDELRKKD